MSILGIILWTLGIVWLIGIIATIYGIMTAEENNDPDEWEGK
jgi:hypothetical protein